MTNTKLPNSVQFVYELHWQDHMYWVSLGFWLSWVEIFIRSKKPLLKWKYTLNMSRLKLPHTEGISYMEVYSVEMWQDLSRVQALISVILQQSFFWITTVEIIEFSVMIFVWNPYFKPVFGYTDMHTKVQSHMKQSNTETIKWTKIDKTYVTCIWIRERGYDIRWDKYTKGDLIACESVMCNKCEMYWWKASLT